MKVKAGTLVILGLLFGAAVALAVQILISNRLFDTRDLQLSLVGNLEQKIAIERTLLGGLLNAQQNDLITPSVLAELLVIPMPDGCCTAELLALLESVVTDGLVTRADGRTGAQASALLSAVENHVSAQQLKLNQLYDENRLIPLLLVVAMLIALVILWLGYRFGVIRPIGRLITAVEESRFGGSFTFPLGHFAPEEITSLARSFNDLVNKLENALATKSEEFDDYQSTTLAAAERTASELAELVNSSSAPIFILEPSGVIKVWNRKVADMTKYPAKSVIGKSFEAIFIDPASRLKFLSAFRLAIGGEPQEGLRLLLSAPGIKSIELLVSLSPQTDVRGRIFGVMCVGNSVSEFLESTHRELEMQRVRHFSELASGAAHQLNQPLQSMRLLLANANNRLRLPDIDREVVAAKVKGADEQLSRLAEIVEHMRVFGQQVKPVPGGFDLRIIVDRCVDLARAAFNERGIRLVLKNELKDQKIQGHPVQIERTLIALLDNAREALFEIAPEFPQVDVSAVAADEGRIVITIKDNGGGIDEAVMPKVFDPFFTTKINSKNTGLGLAEAARLMGQLNGDIALTNTPLGITASVSMPVISASEER